MIYKYDQAQTTKHCLSQEPEARNLQSDCDHDNETKTVN